MTEKILSFWYWLEQWSLICFAGWALLAGLDWLFGKNRYNR
jgi:hypothetical protein